MELWDIPRYSPTEAGRLVRLRPERVRRWIKGYEYFYSPPGGEISPVKVRQRPVISRPTATDPHYASFLDLVDLLFVKTFVEHGFSLQRIRKALAEADSIIGGHHFAQRCYFTDGREIYLQVRDKGAENLLQLLSGGQWVIADVIMQVAKQVDFDEQTGLASKWYPSGRGGLVVLDPRVCFGAPSIPGKGVRTANVLDLYLAESRQIDRVASWMRIGPAEVEAAVEFEEALAA